jgi:hypothetical protein
VRSSTTSLHKNGFGLENIQSKPTLNLLPWPQEGLVYIDLKLVTISQLPPKIWPKKGPNIPQYWPKISKNRPKIYKNHYNKVNKPTFGKIMKQAPKNGCTPPFSRSHGTMWPSTNPLGAAHWPLLNNPWLYGASKGTESRWMHPDAGLCP